MPLADQVPGRRPNVGPRRSRCRRLFSNGPEPHRACDYCPGDAVFHWTDTYPDVMLCASCLELYPEALRLLAKGMVRLEGDLCRTSAGQQPDQSLIWPLVR